MRIAFPAALAVAADPLASLIDTAFIGHLGPVELAAAGVSIALFNQASKLTIFPLVSVTTSFVAEEDTTNKINNILAAEKKFAENGEAKANGHLLQDIEGGASKENTYTPTKSFPTNDEKNNLMPEDLLPENVNRDGGDLKNESNNANVNGSKAGRKKPHLASASTALIFATILGLCQAATLIFADKPLLRLMGVKQDSPMLHNAAKYLRLRSLGAPAMLLAVAMQGILRGFKDTITPLYVILSGYALNIALDPLLIFYFKWGLMGAAISHVVSQYYMALVLLLILTKKLVLLPPSSKDLQIFKFLKNGGLLLAKVIATTSCVTLAASMASRLGPIPMAAFQTCLQVWLTASLLADGIAVAVQAILACSFAEKNYDKVTTAATRTLQMGFVLGVGLSLVVGIGLYFGAGVFTNSVPVMHLIKIAIPFVAATQPINSLAFVFDGVNYGASDFAYSAYSLILMSLASNASLFLLSKSHGFVGIWIALTIYISLRMFAGIVRMGSGTGPWRFLRARSLS